MACMTEKASGGTAGLDLGAQTKSSGTHFHCLSTPLSSLIWNGTGAGGTDGHQQLQASAILFWQPL